MQTATQTSTAAVRSLRNRMTAIRSLPLMAVLSLFLLFAQAVEHGHSHEANLQAQFDCEICLKIGSLEDVLPADAHQLAVLGAQPALAQLTQDIDSSAVTIPTARGPPSHT